MAKTNAVIKPISPKKAVEEASKIIDVSVIDAVNRILLQKLDPYCATISREDVASAVGCSVDVVKLPLIMRIFTKAGWEISENWGDDDCVEALEFDSGVCDE